MDEQKQKLIERISGAQNILVTVSRNPSVDQLSAAIGLTLVLNQMDKHGTAVFSGVVPSTIEFLKPEVTLEKNTDSLRDFIIALDKSKADKLRYKVEDEVVRIFITPYKTSLTEKDLDFSQGDFNVDVVIALGVNEQQDLDAAITAHGRILHDATVASISTTGQGSFGSIDWVDPKASSLSEMMVALVDGLDKKALNNQVATALLTGIVANTERFRNDKTTPKTMSAAATLMAAGANQQLIATELETPPALPEVPLLDDVSTSDSQPAQDNHTEVEAPKPKPEPGTLEISHVPEEQSQESSLLNPTPSKEPENPQIHVDENGQLSMPNEQGKPDFLSSIGLPPGSPAPAEQHPTISHVRGVGSNGQATDSDEGDELPKTEVHRELITDRPEISPSTITANTQPESDIDVPTEELTLPALDAPLLSHTESVLAQPPMPQASLTPPPAPVQPQPYIPPAPASFLEPAQKTENETLADIEKSVSSPHLHMGDTSSNVPESIVDDARNAVQAAFGGAGDVTRPIAALNAQPLGDTLDHSSLTSNSPAQQPYIPPANLFSPAPAQVSPVPNTGFNEPTPGNTPADDTLDMPLPGASFAQPTQQSGMTLPSTPQSTTGQTPPPPVPPPMLPPLQ